MRSAVRPPEDGRDAGRRGSHGRGRIKLDERRELDHRMANSLQLAADFLIFEYARVADPTARDALMTASARLSAVGQLHRFLCSHDQRSHVDFDTYLAELAELVGDSTGLSCAVDADPCRLPGGVAQLLAIAVNELAMNAAKHAYARGAGGALRIESRRQGGRLRLTVSDRGRGLGEGFDAEHSPGLGMTIVGAVARQLHGLLSAGSDHGAWFTLSVPIPSDGAPVSRSFSPPDRR